MIRRTIYNYDFVAPGARRSYCFGRRGRAQLAGHADTVIILMRYIISIGEPVISVSGKLGMANNDYYVRI